MTYFPATTITFEAALRDLETGSDRHRAAAASAMGDLVDPAERTRAIEVLIPATNDRRAEVRAAAVSSLGELGGETAVEALIACLDDGAPVVRQVAAISLANTGSVAAFEPLEELLKSGPPDMRFQAATSLAELDPERAEAPLLTALDDDDDAEVIGATALALAAIGSGRATTAMVTHLRHENENTRFEVAYGLARLGDSRGTEILLTFLDQRSRAWDVIEGVELASDRKAIPALLSLLERRFADRELRLRAAKAVLVLGSDDEASAVTRAREELERGLRAWKLHIRALSVSLIGEIGGSWALDALRGVTNRRAARGVTEELSDAITRLEVAE